MKKLTAIAPVIFFGLMMIAFLNNPLLAQDPPRGPQDPGQPGRGPGMGFIPDLTPEQSKQIEQLRTRHIRKVDLLRAEIGEKEARMTTLRLADEPDAKAIDKTIDEISKLRGDIMKEREAHRREIRALLTDAQKAVFDRRGPQGRFNDGNGDRKGRRGKAGRGYRDGNGPRPDCPYNR